MTVIISNPKKASRVVLCDPTDRDALATKKEMSLFVDSVYKSGD